ncbi:MAG TPA: hypothetical protein DD635_04300 [Flavobacteriales bacterium]|nr:hypothetical protein [Flavobacteriales bacterium]|tara:strand:+ start:85 stop:564 length:480 start_codon:yes stop_codon:yes gene_type:complete
MTELSRIFLAGAVWFTGINASLAQELNRSLQVVEQCIQKEDKLAVVYFYTEWCSVCHAMQQRTILNTQVQVLLEDYFAFVAFDAESREPVEYSGRVFRYQPSGPISGIHELALELASVDGKINYPTITIFNSENEILFQQNGFMGADALVAVLRQFVDN